MEKEIEKELLESTAGNSLKMLSSRKFTGRRQYAVCKKLSFQNYRKTITEDFWLFRKSKSCTYCQLNCFRFVL